VTIGLRLRRRRPRNGAAHRCEVPAGPRQPGGGRMQRERAVGDDTG